jgi:hypothetical protein
MRDITPTGANVIAFVFLRSHPAELRQDDAYLCYLDAHAKKSQIDDL